MDHVPHRQQTDVRFHHVRTLAVNSNNNNPTTSDAFETTGHRHACAALSSAGQMQRSAHSQLWVGPLVPGHKVPVRVSERREARCMQWKQTELEKIRSIHNLCSIATIKTEKKRSKQWIKSIRWKKVCIVHCCLSK